MAQTFGETAVLNRPAIERLIVWLETPEQDGVGGFDMTSFYDDNGPCGTTCCLAGATVLFCGTNYDKRALINDDDLADFDVAAVAARMLGISQEQGFDLFYAMHVGTKKPWAAACLKRLLRTGRVDWDAARADLEHGELAVDLAA